MSRRDARFTETDVNRGEAFVQQEIRAYHASEARAREQRAEAREQKLAPAIKTLLRVAKKLGGGHDLEINSDNSVNLTPTATGSIRIVDGGKVTTPNLIGRIYFVGFAHYVKIGYTSARSAAARVAALQTACPEKLVLYYEMDGETSTEAELHRRFAEDRLEGEWFTFSDAIRSWIEAQHV